MNRTAQVRIARLAGGVLLATALLPVVAAGSALAADDSAAPSVSASASATSSADEVGIGDAVKIGNPDASADSSQGGTRAAVAPRADDSTEVATAVPDGTTATPSGGVVIETESHQPASESADPTDTSVAVLGTKVGSSTNTLASTGPSKVGNQVLLALALIGSGLLLVSGPKLWANAQRVAVRRH